MKKIMTITKLNMKGFFYYRKVETGLQHKNKLNWILIIIVEVFIRMIVEFLKALFL
jgi:hypothetical protein